MTQPASEPTPGETIEDVEPLEDVQDVLPPRAVVRPHPLASPATRRKLADGLRESGLDEGSIEAVTRGVEDPESVLRQLKAPSSFGVHGGSLLYVTCKLRIGSVLPIPTNPRVASRVRYEAGAGAGIEPLRAEGSSTSAATLVLTAGSRASLEADMADVRDQVIAVNNLSESVFSQGILLPLTVLPVEFRFRDGTAAATVLASIDGSSRLTAAMTSWDMSSSDALFDRTPTGPLETAMKVTEELLALDIQSLSAGDLARLRNAVVPANLIVGVSHDGVPPYTLPQVLDSYLGLIHVEPPTPWGEAASQDKRADAVLDELERLGRLAEGRKSYLAGLMSPTAATEAGYDASLDGHAAAVFWELDRRRNANAVNRALRRIGMKNPTRETRLEVATELAMRPYRRSVTDVQRRNPRLALPSAMIRMRPDNAWSPRNLDVADLLAAALSELDAGPAGESCRELAVRGAFWLTRYSALQKSSRRDTRFADEVLEQMLHSPHGLHVLYQAVVDGRSGTLPRQVRDDGTIVETADGSSRPVDDQWLRITFPPPVQEPEDEPDDEVPSPENDPVTLLRQRIYGIRDDVESLERKVAALDDVEVDGSSLVEERGIPTDTAQEIKGNLRKIDTRVTELEFTWRRSGGPAGD